MQNLDHYQNIKEDNSLPDIEKQILDFWDQDNTFEKSITIREKDKEFVFYDGPPFANGLPHYGHLLTGFAKDTIARYHTMQGKKVERRFGWDCHGLPAEMYTEKKLGISGKNEIEKFGIDKFNQECKSSVMLFSSEWEYYVSRQGRWVDFKNDYKTMDTSFMESVLWAFKQMYEKELIYESVKVVPYSWACQTPLSNFETRLDNAYREKKSKAVTVAFELIDDMFGDGKKSYLLAWTTTPWTLPSNMMLGISAEITYKAVEVDGKYYIASSSYHKNKDGIEIKSQVLVGRKYEPLFHYFSDKDNAFIVREAGFVTADDGTGVVHIAPAFGEEDFELAKLHNVEPVCPVDEFGKFTNEISDFAQMHIFDANSEIIKILKIQNAIIKVEEYTHNYPHCWRTDTPLIYKIVPSWYVNVTKIKKRMCQLNQEINWIPSHIKDGLFGQWLENAKDWSISRNRFWGTPIPVWKSNNPKYPRIDVYGSISELERDFCVKIDDLHRPFIDSLTRTNPDDPTGNSKMVRVEGVLDCWFESGSMPFAQLHYPFENKERFEKNFPSDFIIEYVAQTRGWFYTLMVVSTALFDKAPFKNCLAHGVILDGNGKKLSKRLNNYRDPKDIFDEYGADALRFLMFSSSVMSGGNLLIDKDGESLKDVIRLIIKPMFSAYNFFVTYANFHNIRASELDSNVTNILDQYILSKYAQLISDMSTSFSAYNLQFCCKSALDFIDVLNNWYIRRSRERFVKGEKTVFNLLHYILSGICICFAPILPMICEKIWLLLNSDAQSVHLQCYPTLMHKFINIEVIQKMDSIRDICNCALSIRNKNNVRIRQPLKTLEIIGKSQFIDSNDIDFLDLLMEESNVQNVCFKESDPDIQYVLKLNFPVIGKKYPQEVKQMIKSAQGNQWENSHDGITLNGKKLQEDEYQLTLKSDIAAVQQLKDSNIAIKLDLHLNEQMILEGTSRDLIRTIQKSRKSAGLTIQEKIIIKISTSCDVILSCLSQYSNTIAASTYSSEIIVSNELDDCFFIDKISDELTVGFKKNLC